MPSDNERFCFVGGGKGEGVVCLGFLGRLGVVVGLSLNRQPRLLGAGGCVCEVSIRILLPPIF